MSNLRSILAFSISILISKLLGLCLQPWITYWLGLHDYGKLDVLIAYASCLSLLIIFGLVDALYRFVHDKNLNPQCILSTAWKLILCWGAVLLVLIFYYLDELQILLPAPVSRYSIFCLSLTIYFNALTAIPLARLKIEDKAKQFMVVMIKFSLLQACCVLLLAPYWKVEGIVTAGLIAQLSQLLLLRDAIPKGNIQKYGVLLRYGRTIMISGTLSFLSFGAERWVIAGTLSPTQLAPYAVAIQWSIAASLLMEPFSQWWFPRRFNCLNHPDTRKRTADISVLGCQLSCFVSALIIIIISPFLLFWLPSNFHLSAELLPLLALAMCFKYAGNLLNIGCFHQQSGHSVMIIAIIQAISYTPILFMLIPQYGLMSAIYGAIFIQCFRLLLYFFWSQHLLPMPYPLWRYGISLLLLGFICVCHYYGPRWLQGVGLIILAIQILYPWRTWINHNMFDHTSNNTSHGSL